MNIAAGNRPDPDDQLMTAYRNGDGSAFDTLYGKYRDTLYGYFYRHCYNDQHASELFQEVWLRVIASSKRFEGQGRFRSWIFTLAHNCLVDFYRKQEKEQLHGDYTESEADGTPDGAVGESQFRTALEQSLARLPLDQRQAFYLREEQGFSVKEIAEIQGITVEAAKSRLRYAFGKLRNSLTRHDRSG